MAVALSGITVPTELKSRLRGLATSNGVVRFTITDQVFAETNHASTGATVDFRYKKAGELVSNVRNRNQPCYIVVLLQNKQWSLITYVPDNTPTREKMIYSSSKEALVDAWPEEITTMVQASEVSDITDYDSSQPKERPLSQREMDQEEMTKMESTARIELQHHTKVFKSQRTGSGGYHVVQVPLTRAATDALKDFATKRFQWVEFKILEGATNIDVANTCAAVSAGGLPVSDREPRFYLYRIDGSVAFIYVCPEASPQKYRMVYSTSKPAMRDGIERMDITIKKTIEYSTASEVTTASIGLELNYRAPLDMGSPNPGSKSVNSHGTTFGVELKRTAGVVTGAKSPSPSPASLMDAPHPVYKMGIASSLAGARKKIVIPPPGAY